jgi:hypothetical protein
VLKKCVFDSGLFLRCAYTPHTVAKEVKGRKEGGGEEQEKAKGEEKDS